MKQTVRRAITMTTLGLASAAGAAQQRPNILFIPVDDLKPLLGCYGHEQVKTPHIDALARRGTVFLRAYCQQAVCGPTRASLLTGLYPDKTRVYDLKTRMRDINPDILSLPQYFRQNGYITAGLGKTFDPRCVDKDNDAPSWSLPYGARTFPLVYNPNFPNPAAGGYQNPAVRALVK
ncbi:MAG: sulfatase, partial [Lentisphaerae bacterium]